MKQIFSLFLNRASRFFFVILFVFGFFGTTNAQTPPYYNFTTAAGANSFPLNVAAGKGVQWLVRPGEFATPSPAPAGSNITNIWFNVTALAGSGTFTSFQIRLGQTAALDLTTGAAYAGALTTVFTSASYTINYAATGWINIPITNFLFDPTQSLVVEVTNCGLSGTGTTIPQNTLVGIRRSYFTPAACVQAYVGQDATCPGIGLTLVPAVPCSTPADQPTALSFSAITTSSISGSFTAATSAPTNYLVVRYPAGSAVTNPVGGATYLVGGYFAQTDPPVSEQTDPGEGRFF